MRISDWSSDVCSSDLSRPVCQLAAMNTEPTETEVTAEPMEIAAPVVVLSPGTMIREARQAQHLSVDDLAGQTKLARTTVEALERDDFGALLEPVYVRGYYRKCATVLGVDEKALIAAYSSRVAQRVPPAPTKLRLAYGSEPIGQAHV